MSISNTSLEAIQRLAFYQKIDLPDGSTTNGKVDHRKEPDVLGLKSLDFKGKRFLDIASNDGYWAFWAEKAGAIDVLAIDVEKYEDYDWGLHGCPKEYIGKTAKNVNFDHLKVLFNSKVKREHTSVYDLSAARYGTFDFTFCYGLMYHLRHPLLAIDKIRQVTSGFSVIKTHTMLNDWDIPQSVFFMDDVFDGAITNWTGATESCMVHWMKDAGFKNVFAQKRDVPIGIDKRHWAQIFIGTVDDRYTSIFDNNRNFLHCDKSYFYQSRRRIRNMLNPYAK